MHIGESITQLKQIFEADVFKGPDPKEVEKRQKALGDWVVTAFTIDWKEEFTDPLYAIVIDDMIRKIGGDRFSTEIDNDVNDSRVLVISSKKMTQRQAQKLFDDAPMILVDGYSRGKSYADLLKKMTADQYEEMNAGLHFVQDMEEAADPFRGANPEEIQQRKDDYIKGQRKRMFDKADKEIPGSVRRLKAHYNNDDLVETAIAYADSYGVGEIVGADAQHFVSPARHDPTDRLRDLGWDGFWTDGATFIKQCEIVGGYNDFGPEIGEALVRDFPDKEFRLARESSPAVYIRPFSQEDLPYQYDAGQDEMNISDGELRLWYD